MMSRLLTAAAALGTLSLISTPAAANCGGSIYCTSGGAHASHASNSGATYGSGYGYTTEYGGVASDAYADSVYGSGSVSETYTLDNYSSQSYSYGSSYGGGNVVSFPVQASSTGYASASNWTVPGLGMNERLSPTDCPTAVYNPEGGKVLGCYSVVRPAPVMQQRVQVVRPVIYVPYAVPTPVWNGCTKTVVTHSSRYGDYGHYGYGRRGGCR